MLPLAMDPDILYPSLEGNGRSEILITHDPTTQDRSAATSRAPKTPLKSKSQSPSHGRTPAALQRSPSSASARSERQSSPSLHAQRSLNNLNTRGVTPQFRRASSNLNPASPASSQKSGTMTPDPQRKPWTPSSVASAFFTKELDQHPVAPSKTVVIVHDSCYGHRFSRPRTTKSALGLIVERPERIQATMLGASLAYVRLGGRHADSSYPPHPDVSAPTESIPFSIRKTTRNIALNHPAVTAVHGTKWMEELQIMCDSAEAKLALNGKELARPIGYGKDESGKQLPKLHEGDLYLCSETLAALQGCLGGVCEAVDTVFSNVLTKRAFVCIRPPGHHCSSDFPSGFCWLNNVHVGITHAAMSHGLTHAAIIDFDLHHGDGSQAIAWDHNTKAKELPKHAAAHKRVPIGYYSLHDINSFPCEWGDEEKVRNASMCIENAHGLSIWNVHLEGWKNHAEFWRLYETRYAVLLEKTRKFLKHHSDTLRAGGVQPNAAIFLSAGFDASEWEGAGMQRHGVNVPTDFYAKFTSDIVALSQEEQLGVEGRIVSVLEGGYSNRALMSGVLSHICGLVGEDDNELASESTPGLGASMAGYSTKNGQSDVRKHHSLRQKHNASWWDVESLETIEAVVDGRMPPQPKGANETAQGNFSSPTQASNAKMTEVARERRSLNAQLEARLSLLEKPIPPPPDVNWSVAAHALSQILIPNDRQINSCRPSDLNAEATRMRKERQSGVGAAFTTSAEPMQLRERKAKVPALPPAAFRSHSRTRSENRRTTIASFNDLPDPNEPVPPIPTDFHSKPRRRSSAASGIISGLSGIKLSDDSEQSAKSSGTNMQGAAPNGRATNTAVKPAVGRKPRAVPTKPAAAGKAPTRKVAAGMPNMSRQTSIVSDQSRSDAQSISSMQARQTENGSDPSGDLDAITSSMGSVNLGNGGGHPQRIKLKMPSRQEHDANQKKFGDDRPIATKAKVPRKPPVPRAPKVKIKSNPTDTQVQGPITITPGDAAVTQVSSLTLGEHTGSEAKMLAAPPAQAISEGVDSTAGPEARSVASSTTIDAPWAGGAKIEIGEPPQMDAPLLQSTKSASSMETGPTNGSSASGSVNEHGPELVDTPLDWASSQHAHPFAVHGASGAHMYTTSGQQVTGNSYGSRPGTPQRHQLPKFTATSPIPFGRAANASPMRFQNEQKDLEQEENKRTVFDHSEAMR